MAEESMSNRMNRLGKDEILFDRVIPFEEIMEKIQAVTPDDIRAVASEILNVDTFTMAQVGPFDEDDRIAASCGPDDEDDSDE